MPNTKVESIQSLLDFGVPVSQVVDVGVQKATYELIKCFPKTHHLLFEPSSEFHEDIEKNYTDISHQLFGVALSNQAEELYQTTRSIYHDGSPTHSHITPNQEKVDGQHIISSTKIDVKTLDSYKDILQPDFLLKVDVDGKDLEVLQGSVNSLPMASMVVVEATRYNFVERAQFLLNHQFVLANITDRSMYGPAMWQFDYVFIRKDLLDNNELPVPYKNFDINLWKNVDA